ncbi:YihY/virulence factor BrkB family protein [Mesonia sp. K7]|uniref:YihY/virulence factor BrkB family protein n=1 Tax=Mesonia sp. K7 TaxID=2218606 RepID=UPI000DA8F653|nr:YihY/virulence factor BrkB family protein [Mesonia sp. K7]PZD76897.1 ribonuclease BN [Mesonia sp. K7]
MAKTRKNKTSFKRFLVKLRQKAQSWKLPGLEGLSFFDLIKLYAVGIVEGTFSTRASSIAYSFFVAIFPFLLFMLNLIPFVWFIDDFQLKVMLFIESFLPPQTSYIGGIFRDIVATPRAGLLSFVFFLSMFLMANGVNAIFTGFEFSYHTYINRSIIRQYLVALGVSLIITAMLFVSVILIFYFTYIIEDLKNIGIFSDTITWVNIGRYVVFIMMIFNSVCVLYYFGTKEGKESRYFSVGAIFTTLLILLTSFLFSIYIENFSQYNELYGSIGALLIFLLYIWLNANILLLGFELNATLYRLKQKN